MCGALLALASVQALAAQNEFYLFVKVLNLQSENQSTVAITVQVEGKGRLRAIGIFDNTTLFGRFNVAGARVPCVDSKFELCLRFSGELELGDDDSGFPELTRTGFSVSMNLQKDNEGEGDYLIAPIAPFMLKEQPGKLKLLVAARELVNSLADEKLKKQPDDPKPVWARAIALELQERLPEAERDFRSYARMNASDPRGHAMVGRMLLLQGKAGEAERWIRTAIELEPDKALWRGLLGHAFLLQGKEDQALAAYALAVKLMPARRALDESLIRDLKYFQSRGWHSAGAERGLAAMETAFPQAAGFHLGPADEADYLGRHGEAMLRYAQALAVAEKDLGPDHLVVGRIRLKLANNQSQAGQYREALDNYGKSLAIIRARKESSDYDIINIELAQAHLYDKLGQPAQAEKHFRDAVRDSRASKTIMATEAAENLTALAMFLYRVDKSAEALALYKEAIPVLARTMGPSHPRMARHYNDIAILNSSADNHDDALPYFQKALDIYEKYYGEEHYSLGTLLGNVGSEYLAKKDYAKAKEYFVRALNLATLWQTPDVLIHAYSSMQQLMKAQGRLSEAILFGKQAVNEIQKLRRRNATLDKELAQSFTRKNESYYKDLADMLIEQGRLPEAQQVLSMLKEDEFFEFIRRDAGAASRDTPMGFNSEEARWTQRYGEISGRIGTIGAELRELQKKDPAARTDADRERAKTLRADLAVAMKAFNKTVQELQDAFTKLSGERRADLAKKQVDMDQRGMMRDLGHDAALLQYIIMDDALHIILTTRDVVLARKVAVKNGELNRQIQQFRAFLSGPGRDPRPAGKALHDLLIAPVQADLDQAGAKMLMVSLDGALRYIPFAALHDGKGYLAERYALALYTDAARDRIKDAPRPGWQVAALGLSRQVEGFSPLPAVAGELHGIVRQKDGSGGVVPGVVYLDKDFTVDRIQEVLFDQYRVLHIASHFVFTAGTLEKSFLLLGDGSHLSLAQIQQGNYDLGSLEMLTLSACETAVGDTGADGKEVEGLGALAQKKGAKGILATLWPVADQSTGAFMRDLYQIKTAHPDMTKAEALRRAQLAFIRGGTTGSPAGASRGATARGDKSASFVPDASAPWAHPYYWAPFILMGNWL